MLAAWALKQLEKHNRKVIITDRENVTEYLHRYYIAWPDRNHRKRKKVPFNAFLHRFIRSDDPVFHNHPWTWYCSVILKGGYWEHTPWGTHWRAPGHCRFVRGGQVRPLINDDKSLKKAIQLMELKGETELQNPLLHTDLHWVEVPKPGETWTLFIRGETEPREWGFVPDINTGVWIQHEEYLESQRKK